MNKQPLTTSGFTRTPRHRLCLAGALWSLTLPAQAELHYSCDELANMAVHFQNLKTRQYTLEDVLGVVQKAAADNPDKESLLSNLVIEIYIDPAVETAAQARALADNYCSRRQR